ncbi:hypothetical protein [Kribbella sp. NPDC049227]|uniref:hypothetical protein n=1 Tax=Kribbella sp. NPDC049227 TaxID=3364113 RepID=UPI0037192A1A
MLEALPADGPALGAQIHSPGRQQIERRVRGRNLAAMADAFAGLVTWRGWSASKLRRPSAPRMTSSPSRTTPADRKSEVPLSHTISTGAG